MRKPYALLVEDDLESRHLFELMLKSAGFAVTAVEDGRAALSLLQNIRPDVLLTDIAMPGMDGLELIRQIKNNPLLNDLPVVALSAFGEGFLGLATEAGATETMAKPVDYNQLRQMMQTVLAADAAQ